MAKKIIKCKKDDEKCRQDYLHKVHTHKMQPKIKIVKKGDYIHAHDIVLGHKMATYSKRKNNITGATTWFKPLIKFVKK